MRGKHSCLCETIGTQRGWTGNVLPRQFISAAGSRSGVVEPTSVGSCVLEATSGVGRLPRTFARLTGHRVGFLQGNFARDKICSSEIRDLPRGQLELIPLKLRK
ncbi:hypothetical protein K0M31_000950, partial [Melipona bicolor]